MNWHQACELPYYHGSDLGANPTAEDTTFKLWAPTACGGRGLPVCHRHRR